MTIIQFVIPAGYFPCPQARCLSMLPNLKRLSVQPELTGSRPEPLEALAAALPHLTALILPCSGYPLCSIAGAIRPMVGLRELDVSEAGPGAECGLYGQLPNDVAVMALAELRKLSVLNVSHR